jgi:hypothetical protein
MAQSKSAPASSADDRSQQWHWDREYLVSLRELWCIFAFFAVMLCWTIGVSYWLGYRDDRGAPVELIWGAPKWFLFGVAAPWALASIVSIWFALAWMKDDETAEEATNEPSSKEASK